MMRFRLEKRPEPSKLMLYGTPVAAVVLTMILGCLLFSAIGYNGLRAVQEIFFTPLTNPYKWQDLGIKAAPLIIIGTGLSVAYRANVWNIGAEGQYIIGALAATSIALLTWGMSGWWILPLMAIAGMLGGMAYASIPAFLKTRLNVNEILTSLMLTYASVQLIYYLIRGPWKDPMGIGFPQSRLFSEAARLPNIIPGTIVHLGVPIAVIVALIAWFVMSKTVFGYRMRVVGAAPHAARYGGFSENKTIWLAMLVSGGLAGLAGMLEVAGPFQRMVPGFPTNYGFTAIIVAFLGRLNPLGVIVAGVVLAITFVGGQVAQTTIGLPDEATGIFQAMMLFLLLAGDILVRYRIRRISPEASAGAA
ncbi:MULTISPECIES: ABC transporter permease [unclassified Devosia]|uniref:ABC transporter permease n=1 Tax=unclassified Devosia TaxID=196773 RepID=UPI002601071C|nr:ABC transporter permease [Devosia sp.]MCR6633316.1 ABC transporter permease [Devosia sp.]